MKKISKIINVILLILSFVIFSFILQKYIKHENKKVIISHSDTEKLIRELMIGIYATQIKDMESASFNLNSALKSSDRLTTSLNIIEPKLLFNVFISNLLSNNPESAFKIIENYNKNYEVTGQVPPAIWKMSEKKYQEALKILKSPASSEWLFENNPSLKKTLENWIYAALGKCSVIEQDLLLPRKSIELDNFILGTYCKIPAFEEATIQFFNNFENFKKGIDKEPELVSNRLYKLAALLAKMNNLEDSFKLVVDHYNKINPYSNWNGYLWILKNDKELFPHYFIADILNSISEIHIYYLKDYLIAEAKLKLALLLAPKNDDSIYLLTHIYNNTNRKDQALNLIQNINNKNNERYLDALIMASYINEEKGTKSLSNDMKILTIKYPENISFKTRLAEIYVKQKKYQDAVDIYNDLIKYNNKDANLYFYRGALYERLNDWEKAEKDFNHALNIDNNHIDTLNYLGYSLLIKFPNRILDAEKYLQKALQLAPNYGPVIDSIAWLYFKKCNYDKALEYLSKALEILPNDFEVNEHYGDLMYFISSEKTAINYWNRAISNAEDIEERKRIEEKILGRNFEKNCSVENFK